MKALLISLFHPELVRGGAQQVCYELFEGLRDDGTDVTLLASVDESMPALFKSGAHITGFDGRPGEFLFLSRSYDHWWHKVGEPMLVAAFAEFLETMRPDVVHFHHFLTYGVDVVALTRRTLPTARIVFTLHEFIAVCHASGQMVRKTDGSLCTRASPVRCHQCFPEHAPERFFMRRAWILANLTAVDVFTTPTRFMQKLFADWGIDQRRIVHVPNGQRDYAPAQWNRHAAPAGERPNRFGFFGQLVDNKGLLVLLQAATILRQSGFCDFQVEVNGDNLRYASDDNRRQVDAFRLEEEARPLSERNVTFKGSYHVDSLVARMSRVDWCIAPSIWWETFALVISEAWMFGRPVIASNIGAMAERVRHDVDGLLFAVGDARDLAAAMRRACEEQGLWSRLNRALPRPPAREDMVGGFKAIYAGAPPGRRTMQATA